MATQQERAAKLKAVASRSLKLMQMDANGTLDKIAESKMSDINLSLNENSNLTTDSMMNVNRNQGTPQPIQTSRMSAAASNVPLAIRESFQSQPPASNQELTSSVLDGVFGDVLTEKRQQPVQQQVITEQVSQPQAQYSSSQIDYPMIRTIVEEIVRKYTSALNKKLMTESKQTTPQVNTIALGETFKFLDSEGNIYEAKMVKTGNINKKKKNID